MRSAIEHRYLDKLIPSNSETIDAGGRHAVREKALSRTRSGRAARMADPTTMVRPGRDPLVAGKVRHYEDREFAGLFDL